MKAMPQFVARGIIVLDVATFAVDLRNHGFKKASLNLMDPLGVAREMYSRANCMADCWG